MIGCLSFFLFSVTNMLDAFIGGQKFYPLPSLPSLGGQPHQPGHSFNIPSINTHEVCICIQIMTSG